jgi:hypothetical protein
VDAADASASALNLEVSPPSVMETSHPGCRSRLGGTILNVGWRCVQVERLEAELIRISSLLAETTGRADSASVEVSTSILLNSVHPQGSHNSGPPNLLEGCVRGG